MVDISLQCTCLVLSNAAMMVSWLRVCLLFVTRGWNSLEEEEMCQSVLRPALLIALGVSFLELANALVGFTRSKPLQVLLFATVRLGVEVLLSPLMPCGAWQHLTVALCWSLGEIVRFGCFAVYSLIPSLSTTVKSVRYTVGPIMFPIGEGGALKMQLYHVSLYKLTCNRFL